MDHFRNVIATKTETDSDFAILKPHGPEPRRVPHRPACPPEPHQPVLARAGDRPEARVQAVLRQRQHLRGEPRHAALLRAVQAVRAARAVHGQVRQVPRLARRVPVPAHDARVHGRARRPPVLARRLPVPGRAGVVDPDRRRLRDALGDDLRAPDQAEHGVHRDLREGAHADDRASTRPCRWRGSSGGGRTGTRRCARWRAGGRR